MSITVTFNSFKEMKDFAKELLGTGAVVNQKTPESSETEKAEKSETKTVPVQSEAPEKEPAIEPPTAQPETEEATTYSLEDVRAKLAALNKAGKRTQVKELLGSFGVDKLSEIAPEQYTELMEKAEVL